MTESLGLSIGVANLVAALAGSAAVSRKSVLTIFDHRASEVGVPEENPNLTEPGLVMRGFVERVGDGSPLVAADGTKYLGEALTVEALEAMARTVGYGTPIAIAIPAYWSERQASALRDEFFAQPGLAPNGVPPVLISDATAALTALRTRPGFPTDGVVALCDFGAGGTSVTLSNAGSNFQQVGTSVRYTEFSGDEIDQLIANHVRASGAGADTGTVRMSSQARLLGECRRAKEELSGASEAAIATDANILLSRTEFEQLISGPLDRFASALEEILQRNGIRANLAAVATVGGGASIPVLGTRLSERLQVPILSTPQPLVTAAVGAAVLGQQQSSAGAATAAAPIIETPTQMAPAAPAAPPTQAVPTASAAPAPLAWSEDADESDEPVPYTGGEHSGEYTRAAAEFDDPADQRYADEAGRLPWYKRTALVLTVAAAVLAVLVAIVLALTLGHENTNPVNTTPPPSPPTPQTVTITAPDNSTSTTVIQPPPPPPPTTTYNPPPETTYQPPTTTTTAPPSTTTAAPPPTTTQPPVTTTAPTRERPFPLRPFEPPWRRGLG